MKSTFFVDLPVWTKTEGCWECAGEFATREEALKFVQENFGADDQGKVGLVSEIPCDCVEEEDEP